MIKIFYSIVILYVFLSGCTLKNSANLERKEHLEIENQDFIALDAVETVNKENLTNQVELDYIYSLKNGKVNITEYIGEENNLIISSLINSYPVTSIGDNAFFNKKLSSVTIPDSIITIGYQAFYANMLNSVNIGNSVTLIDDKAFWANELSRVIIPNSVTFIGNMAFYGNQLTSVIIPNSVASIGDDAFAYNRLTSVTILNPGTFIGDSAFSYNYLTHLNLPDDIKLYPNSLQYYSVYYDYTKNGKKNKKYDISLLDYNEYRIAVLDNTYIEILSYIGNDKEITIPDRINGLPVIAIGCWAFSCETTYILLNNVIIPNSVIYIGDMAFRYNNLISINIPASVTYLGSWAFDENVIITRE